MNTEIYRVEVDEKESWISSPTSTGYYVPFWFIKKYIVNKDFILLYKDEYSIFVFFFHLKKQPCLK